MLQCCHGAPAQTKASLLQLKTHWKKNYVEKNLHTFHCDCSLLLSQKWKPHALLKVKTGQRQLWDKTLLLHFEVGGEITVKPGRARGLLCW